jgi:hypothetical protein
MTQFCQTGHPIAWQRGYVPPHVTSSRVGTSLSRDWLSGSRPPIFESLPYAHRIYGIWALQPRHSLLLNAQSTHHETIRRYEAPRLQATILFSRTREPSSTCLQESSCPHCASSLPRLITSPPVEMSSKKPAGKAQRSAIADVVAREYTIHMHKRVCLSHPRMLPSNRSKSRRCRIGFSWMRGY